MNPSPPFWEVALQLSPPVIVMEPPSVWNAHNGYRVDILRKRAHEYSQEDMEGAAEGFRQPPPRIPLIFDDSHGDYFTALSMTVPGGSYQFNMWQRTLLANYPLYPGYIPGPDGEVLNLHARH